MPDVYVQFTSPGSIDNVAGVNMKSEMVTEPPPAEAGTALNHTAPIATANTEQANTNRRVPRLPVT
jgi:hypothetical protein